MSSVQNNEEQWSIQEKLALASLVYKNEPNNWNKVSKTLKEVIKDSGITSGKDYSPKECARIYEDLREELGPKKKRSGSGLGGGVAMEPGRQIVHTLTMERMQELRKAVEKEQREFKRLKREVEGIVRGTINHQQIKQMLDEQKQDDLRDGLSDLESSDEEKDKSPPPEEVEEEAMTAEIEATSTVEESAPNPVEIPVNTVAEPENVVQHENGFPEPNIPKTTSLRKEETVELPPKTQDNEEVANKTPPEPVRTSPRKPSAAEEATTKGTRTSLRSSPRSPRLAPPLDNVVKKTAAKKLLEEEEVPEKKNVKREVKAEPTRSTRRSKETGAEEETPKEKSVNKRASKSTSKPKKIEYLEEDSTVPNTEEYRLWKKRADLAVRSIMEHKHANVFNSPVTEKIAPNYNKYVHSPTDLDSIRKDLESGKIQDTITLSYSLNLLFCNAVMYNGSSSNVNKWAKEMALDVFSEVKKIMTANDSEISAAETAKNRRSGRHSMRGDEVPRSKVGTKRSLEREGSEDYAPVAKRNR